jgi:uncharacterized protein (TIGR01777 family)
VTRHIVLVGGSGFLGRGIRDRLVERGDQVTVVGRGEARSHDGWKSTQWDGRTLGPWVGALADADVVVHLAGKRVNCRPTRRNLEELISSREGTVRLVGAAFDKIGRPPPVWVQLSSLARFGDCADGEVDEGSRLPLSGVPQQVDVCRRWEAAYRSVTADAERTVLLRPGIGVGGAGDPATAQMIRLAKLGLAGPVAGGQQWVSWIAVEDLLDLLIRSIDDPAMSGTYHLTAPTPVRNREFMAAYRHAVGRRFGLPSPRLVTRCGAWMLGSDPGLVLTGRACVPTRLLNEGYEFKVTSIDEAVRRAVAAAG